jgi:site-specific DNA-methyltransferase (adenine-specific)
MNTIFNKDCLSGMANLDVGSVDMILSDLPYGTTRNKWDSIIPLEPLFYEYWRVLKSNGIIALTASQPFTSLLVLSQPDTYRHEWIWIKNRGSNFANTVREPMKEHESILIFSRGKWVYNKQMQERTGGGAQLKGARQKDKGGKTDNYGSFSGKDITLSEMRVPSSWQKFNTEVGLHPTQKPVELFEYLIRTYTNPGDLVLDSCMGSGTTAIACIKTGRKYVGFENDPIYFPRSLDRIRGYENH